MKKGKFLWAALIVSSCLVLAAAPSPWDSWRAGYTNFEQGEARRERGNYTDALRYFEKARKNYQAVRSARPDWNQRVIADRLRDCDRQIAELKRLLNESGTPQNTGKTETPAASSNKQTSRTSGNNSGGSRNSYTPVSPAGKNHYTPITAVSSANEKEMAKLRVENAELRVNNGKLNKELQRQRNFESEIAALLRDRKVATDRYLLLEKRFKALQEELKRPDERIVLLEQKLLDERMNIERVSKQLTSLEQQLKIEKENARMSGLAKNALEDLLKRRNEELLNSNKQIADLLEKVREIETLTVKIKGLNTQVDTQKNQISVLNNRIAELNQQNAGLSQQGSNLQNTNTGLQEQITSLNTRIASAENVVKEQTDEIARLKQELAVKNSRVSAMEIELASLRNALASSRKAAEDAAAKEAIARKAAEDAAAKEVEARQAASVASAREAAAAKEMADALAALAAAKKGETSGAAANAELQGELQKSRSRIAGLEVQTAALETQKNELLKQLDLALAAKLEADKENAGLKNELSELRLLADEQKNKLTVANESLRQTGRELADSGEELAKLRKTLAETAENLTAVQKKSAETERKLTSVSGQLTDAREQLESSGVQLEAFKKQYAVLERSLADLRKEHESMGITLNGEKEKNTLLNNENRTIRMNLEQEQNAARLSAAELANLRERNRTLEEDIKRLYDRAEDLERRLSTRNSADFQAATAARSSVKKLEEDLLAAQNELIKLRSELDSDKKALSEYERKLKSVNDENTKARAEVLAASEREKSLQQQINKLLQFQTQYEQLSRDFKALAAENRENRSLLEAARPHQAELERAKLRLMELDQLKSTLAKEQQLSAEMKSAYSRMESELSALRSRAAEFENARRKLVELEARAKEVERLKNVESELSKLRAREVELAALKVKNSEVESSLRTLNVEYAALQKNWNKLSGELVSLRKENAELQRLRRLNNELQVMLSSQNSELEKLGSQLAAAMKDSKKDLHVSCRLEIEKYRAAAADAAAAVSEATTPLNAKIASLQDEQSKMKTLITALQNAQNELNSQLNLKSTEIAELRKLNTDLANMQQTSAAALLNQVDLARLNRLEDEIAALNKLNAELAAERDKLLAQVNRPAEEKKEQTYSGIRDSRPPAELTGAGFVAEKNGKDELAIWNYRQALTNDPEFALAHSRLGMLFFRRGSFKDAIGHLEKAYNAAPDNLQLALTAARCYISLERFGNAKSIIDPLLKKHPENAYIQMCAALIEAGCGAPVRAEEKLVTAARLAPESAEILIELARLLSNSITDRRREAVIAYEKARQLGAAPVPDLEKVLGSMLDQRRELVRFMAGAAREAELNKDWLSAAWYYKKIMEDDHPEYLPLLAFAQWRAGNASAAKESLEFNQVSRNAMVIRALIALSENDMENAMRAAQQSAGAKIPVEWIGVNQELDKLKKQSKPSAAVKILLKSIQDSGSTQGQ